MIKENTNRHYIRYVYLHNRFASSLVPHHVFITYVGRLKDIKRRGIKGEHIYMYTSKDMYAYTRS